MGKLTALQVKNAKPGVLVDGLGLLLRVKKSGARSWILRVQVDGKRRDIGLGSIADLTLIEAREKAAALRKVARQGHDPIAVRDRAKRIVPTFAEAVDLVHADLSRGWAEKTGEAFRSSLLTHAVPVLGRYRVSDIERYHVIAALAPIWTSKPQQARKVRHRILQVLAYAKAHEWRKESVPTPADLRQGLAKQPKSNGFAAMPYSQVPAFFADQMAKDMTSSRAAMLFAILTGARSGEVRNALWENVDLGAKIWSRPANSMKAGVAHSVTLNAAAIELLKRMAAQDARTGLVFPSARANKPLSDMSLSRMLRAAGRPETVHGFRSSFRDWAAEQMPTVPAMVAEMALAHSIGTATEKAYLRSDFKALRFKLLDAWGAFVTGEGGSNG